jgi:hypothetical protein
MIKVAVWVVFVGLWGVFYISPLLSSDFLDEVWNQIGTLALPFQVIIWLLFFPLMVGLWIWQATWPVVVRVALITGISWITIGALFPWSPWRTSGKTAA